MSNLINGGKTISSSATEDISIGNGIGEEDFDVNGKTLLQSNISEEEIEKIKKMDEYKEEMLKIQEDIATLRLVLNDKIKRENELKSLLGISFVDEMKHDIAEGLNTIKSTTGYQKAAQTISDLGTTVTQNDAYQKTAANLKTVTEKITPSFSNIGNSVKSGLGSFRNSKMFKSFETGIFSSVNKMKSSQSEFVIDDKDPDAMSTSKSTLGSTTAEGVKKNDIILENN